MQNHIISAWSGPCETARQLEIRFAARLSQPIQSPALAGAAGGIVLAVILAAGILFA